MCLFAICVQSLWHIALQNDGNASRCQPVSCVSKSNPAAVSPLLPSLATHGRYATDNKYLDMTTRQSSWLHICMGVKEVSGAPQMVRMAHL